MGQSASLYLIDKSDFSRIIENPDDFGLFNIAKGYEIFEKTFEGLRFVLSKGLDKTNAELVDQIFYPVTFVGKELDYKNITDDFDPDKHPVYYNEPSKVAEIFKLLDTISTENFQRLFDPDELNNEGIYPGDIWNRRTEENYAFNVRDMTLEFIKLKSIFETAKNSADYLLSYVG